MTHYLFGLSLGFVALLMSSIMAPAQSRNMCAERDAVVSRLAGKYGETRRALGLAAQKGVMEIYASTDTGSWTITVTLPNGLTCLLASGNSFETVDEELPASSGAPT